ncbi:MAG: HTH domain-containing protein [Candidatus Thorarchaeota archaeon]|nr:HTH domain-containing protein [Candidatus Thorarchaeota archaeon]
MMLTRREEIIRLLESTDQPMTAQEICDILDVRKRSIVYEDINHIAHTVRNQGKEVIVKPASCGKCHYVFKVKDSAKAPTKCPKCRSEWILAPSFFIRMKK